MRSGFKTGCLLFLVFALNAIYLPAVSVAPVEISRDTVWNQTDDRGLKQGWWKRDYPGGGIMYRGYFVDNNPSGRMYRYYENGSLKAEMDHLSESDITYTKMFFRNGQLGAEGKYIRQKKDSIWTYYSYYTGKLAMRESYREGLRQGPVMKYYKGGQVAEILYWENDIKQGSWKQFYEDSTLRLSSSHVKDEIHGNYRIFGRDKKLIIEGNYNKGSQDGEWKYYDTEGKLDRTLQFNMGVPADKEKYEAWLKEFMDEVEKDIGTIPEPDMDNFFDRKP